MMVIFIVAESDHKNWWQYIVRPLAPPSSHIQMENRIYFSLYIIWDKQSTRELWPGSKCSILHSNCHKYLNHFFPSAYFWRSASAATWRILDRKYWNCHSQDGINFSRNLIYRNDGWCAFGICWTKFGYCDQRGSSDQKTEVVVCLLVTPVLKKVSHRNCPLLKIRLGK